MSKGIDYRQVWSVSGTKCERFCFCAKTMFLNVIFSFFTKLFCTVKYLILNDETFIIVQEFA